MTDLEKITTTQVLVENDAAATSELVSVYLKDAEAAIFRRLYPFGIPASAVVPPLYEMLQCKLAARYFLRRGAEGEIRHNENGYDRTYQSVNDEDLLCEVIQIAKVG